MRHSASICGVALILVSSMPVALASEITWTEKTSPTTEDLYGVTAGDDLIVAVGNAGTLITSTDGDTWAAVPSGTSADLFDVNGSPPSVAISGREVVLEWDGVGLPVVLEETSGGEAFTPVRPTSSAVWFGQPSFGIGFSFLFRHDRVLGQSLGLVTSGPVLEMCVPPGGTNVIYVTTAGDVVEIDDTFVQDVLFEHDILDPYDLVAAAFDEDCSRIMASHRHEPEDFRVLELEVQRTASSLLEKQATGWEERTFNLPSGMDIIEVRYIHPSWTYSGILYSIVVARDQGRIRMFYYDGTSYKEERYSPEALDLARYIGVGPEFFLPQISSEPEGTKAANDAVARALTAVGEGGVILGATYIYPVFTDGFESGTLDRWSSKVP